MSDRQGDLDDPARDTTSRERELYRQVVEHMESCLAVYEAVDDGEDFVFVEFNTAAERSESMPRERLLGRRVTEVFPGVDKFGLLDVFRRVWRTGIAERHPVALYVDDQHSGWRENYVSRLPGGEIIAVYEDVTERVMAEQALRESEQRFRLLFERAPVPYQSLDREGVILDVNAAWLEALGYSREEVVGRSFADFQGARSAESFPERFAALLAAGENRGVEVELRRKDRSTFLASFEGRVGTDPASMGVRTHCVFVDITEQRQATAALREALEWQERIFEGSRDAVFISDEEARFTAVNAAASALTGYSREELLGMRIPDLHDETDLHAFQQFSARILAGESIVSEAPIRRKDGSKVEGEFSNSGFTIGDRRFMHTAARDVTARKQAEAQLTAQIEELRRWHELTLGREERIIELKREVNAALARTGEPPRYATGELDRIGGEAGEVTAPAPPYPSGGAGPSGEE